MFARLLRCIARRMMPVGVLCLLAAALHAQIAPPPILAPAVDPPAIAERRALFEKSAARETIALNDLFEPHLASLETASGASGDYATALASRQRRAALAASSKELRELLSGEGAAGTALALSDAKVAGGVSLEAGALTGWRNGGSSVADWVINQVQPGKYAVEVEFRLTTDASKASTGLTPANPRLRFREVSSLAGAAANFVLVALQSADLSMTLRAQGEINLVRLPALFRMEAESLSIGQTLSVSAVKLIPVMATPLASSVPTVPVGPMAPFDGDGEFSALMKLHEERLKSAREPVVRDYLEMLASLGQKGAGERVVTAETRRAKKLLELGGEKGPAGMAGGKTGFTSLAGVKYVADAANTGDRFKVEHEGQTFWVRLLWTTCPPLEAKSGQAMRVVRERFKIDELSALALGQTAREFTELYLQGRDLKLLARATPDDDGALLALVYVEPVGLFQHVLVDHGLAVVDAPASASKKAALEAGLLAAMEEREKRAKAAVPPEGGWGYGK